MNNTQNIEFLNIGCTRPSKKSCNLEASTGNSFIFTCEPDGNVESFPTAQGLEDHLIIGHCTIKVEKEKNLDKAVMKYANKLNVGCQEQYTMKSSTTNTLCVQSILEKGWTLKQERKVSRFSQKQKDFLENKFNNGIRTGQKEDPVSVSEEMRILKDCTGNRVFTYEELLTSQQIASFFSRMCKKSKGLQCAVRETLINKVHDEVIDKI